MAIHQDLLAQARRLAHLDPMRPRQANLRRAVSSAYYALFHYLTDQACRMMIGTQRPQLPFRQVIARGFDHGTMKEACRSFSGGNLPRAIVNKLPAAFAVPMALKNVTRAFVELQEQRRQFRVHDTVCESADAETSRSRQEAGTAGENPSSHPLPHGRGSSISTDFQLDFQSASRTPQFPLCKTGIDVIGNGQHDLPAC